MTRPLRIAAVAGVHLFPAMANRHGHIAGATGPARRSSCRCWRSNAAGIGVPVFAAEVKGDVSGISQACDCAATEHGCQRGNAPLGRQPLLGQRPYRPGVDYVDYPRNAVI
jgi:hypothetical protein